MRDAMKAAEEAGRFKDSGFDVISMRSENRGRTPLDSLSTVDHNYVSPSQKIRSVTEELMYLKDKRYTSKILDKIV
jgi:hypothetical protein